MFMPHPDYLNDDSIKYNIDIRAGAMKINGWACPLALLSA
ncbi:MAG: hypothetical protein ACI88A_001424 [Paraglaciecola sp.]|jgi:hypothetical protein